MQEQYWQRTRGAVRTALEQCMLALEAYGLSPEMGHKEVGGMKGHMDTDGNMTHVCGQVEIDWKFADALQAADNELVVRILVKEIFRENGLEVNFKAKPMIGLAGNGEHTHFGIGAIMNDGSFVNLFAPTDMKKDFMSAVGYGAIMGLLKNYEVINPFVSATNDSLNRLKPGFEAPVCIVTSLGHKPEVPSRNRTILAGLIRDVNNPKATRFELRACNPYTNTYLVLAAIYTSILDGVKYAVTKTTAELLAEISKDVGDDAGYLEKDRAYRAEDDVFEDYTEEELQKVAELDKVITEAEKDALIDTIIVKTQGFVNGNIKEGDKNPVSIFKRLLALYKDINRDALRENMRYFLSAIMPVCEEYGVNMCVHPDDPPFQVLGLPRIVTNENDIEWFLNAVDNPHNGLTFCAGSLSAGEHNDTRELAKKFAKRTHFVHLRSTAAMQGGNFIESSHLTGRGHLVDLIRIFENENPGLPMRVDHGRMMLGDEDKGYNPGYSFHGRMLALAQVEGMMAVVDDEKKRQIIL